MAGKLGTIIKFVSRWNGAQCVKRSSPKKCKLMDIRRFSTVDAIVSRWHRVGFWIRLLSIRSNRYADVESCVEYCGVLYRFLIGTAYVLNGVRCIPRVKLALCQVRCVQIKSFLTQSTEIRKSIKVKRQWRWIRVDSEKKHHHLLKIIEKGC